MIRLSSTLHSLAIFSLTILGVSGPARGQEGQLLPPGPYWIFEEQAGFEEAVELRIHDPSGPSDLYLESPTFLVASAPTIWALPEIPGGAWILENPASPGGWDLYASGAAYPLAWDPVDVAFETTIDGFEVSIQYKAAHAADKLGGRVGLRPLCADKRFVGVQIALAPGGPLPQPVIEFQQFVTMNIRYEGIDANGDPASGEAPDGTRVNVDHPGSPALADGSSTYSDARPGSGGLYPAAPQQAGKGRSMTDGPGGFGSDSIHWPGGTPPIPDIEKLIFEMHFVTYLLYNGEVVYRVDWDVTQTVLLLANGQEAEARKLGGPGGTVTGRDAEKRDDHHDDALNALNGTPPGAQVPGTTLPDNKDR